MAHPSLDTYEPDPSLAALAAELGVPRVAKLDANECHLGPFPRAVEAARAALDAAHRYPQHGVALHERLAARHGVSPACISIGPGADALIGQLCLAAVEAPGDEVLAGKPSFPSYRQDALRAGGRPVEALVRADGALDLEAMADRVGPRTRLVFVCSPNNPTGGALASDEVERFLAAVPAHVLVVLDEAYADYAEGGAPSVHPLRPNVVRLRTFSKLFGLAGLRVGYLVASPAVATAVRRIRHWYDVGDAAQLAAAASLDDPAEEERRRVATAAARAALAALLRRHGLEPLPSVTNFVAAPVQDASGLTARLRAQGVLVRPVPAPSGDLVRISVGDTDDLAQLDAALARVGLAAGSA